MVARIGSLLLLAPSPVPLCGCDNLLIWSPVDGIWVVSILRTNESTPSAFLCRSFSCQPNICISPG